MFFLLVRLFIFKIKIKAFYFLKLKTIKKFKKIFNNINNIFLNLQYSSKDNK